MALPTSKTSLVQNTKSWPYFCLFFLLTSLLKDEAVKRKKSYILPEPVEVLNCSVLVTTKWIAILIPAQPNIAPILSKLLRFCRENTHKKANKISRSQLNYLFLMCCQHVMYLWAVAKKCFSLDLPIYSIKRFYARNVMYHSRAKLVKKIVSISRNRLGCKIMN